MGDQLLVFLTSGNEGLRDKVKAVSPRIEVVSREDLEHDESLWGRLDVVYGWLKGDEFAKATGLQWFQSTSAGVNSYMNPDILARDFTITTVSGIHAEPIAEQMFGMVLVVTRRLHVAWQAQREHRWGRHDSFDKVTLLAGKTLGVLGVGAIGGYAATLGKAFGMKVVGLRHSKKPHPDVETMYGDDERAEFFGQCDVVMNILPGTEATDKFVGEAEFAAMKKGVIFVNAGRGSTVDTGALLNALESGQVGATCLDVTDPEPLPEGHPLWDAPNVFITPHTSGGRPDYGERAAEIFLDNLHRFVDGQELRNVVNREAGY